MAFSIHLQILLEHIDIYQIKPTDYGFTADQLVSLILNTIKKEE